MYQPDYLDFLGPTIAAGYEIALNRIQQSSQLVAPDTVYIDPASALAQAVASGEFVDGELSGPQPAGSMLRQSFADNFWLYLFRPGQLNRLVWCRTPKL